MTDLAFDLNTVYGIKDMLNGIYSIAEKFPGVDNIPTMLNLRSIGTAGNRETFGAGFIRKGPGADFVDRAVDHYALVYVLRGQGRYIKKDGTVHTLSEGMVFQRLPDEIHSTFIDSDEGWFEGFIALGKHMYNSLKVMGIINSEKMIVARVENENQKRRIIKQFYNLALKMSSFDDREILPFMSDELQAIQELINIEPVRDVLGTFCEAVTHEPGRRVNVKDFCREQNVGYEWFRKAFKEKTQFAPAAFAITQRIEKGAQLLRTTNFPIFDIAYQLGYKTQYEFSAQFKKYSGMGPAAFRKQGREIQG
ncbi:MAG: helix-turn-helix transcriptional regulator [Spirochaetales bacterium]|nr:helix-turn-helix transcriptional regulator [Spirochaetales bacterium]